MNVYFVACNKLPLSGILEIADSADIAFPFTYIYANKKGGENPAQVVSTFLILIM